MKRFPMKMKVVRIPNHNPMLILKEMRLMLYPLTDTNIQFMVSQEIYKELYYGEFEDAQKPFTFQHFCNGWWHLKELKDEIGIFNQENREAETIVWFQLDNEPLLEFANN